MRRLVSNATLGLAGAVQLLAGVAACPNQGYAQEPERAPLANAFGRFWGFGWSAGYHSRAENRFGVHRYMPDHNVVPDPVRGAAASQHLGGPNSTMYPGNAPIGGYYGVPMHMSPTIAPMPSGGYYQPGSAATMMNGNSMGGNSMGGNLVPAPAAKPVEPPPSWLKQYMKPDAVRQESDDNLLDETSPSDRRSMRYPNHGISILQ